MPHPGPGFFAPPLQEMPPSSQMETERHTSKNRYNSDKKDPVNEGRRVFDSARDSYDRHDRLRESQGPPLAPPKPGFGSQRATTRYEIIKRNDETRRERREESWRERSPKRRRSDSRERKRSKTPVSYFCKKNLVRYPCEKNLGQKRTSSRPKRC